MTIHEAAARLRDDVQVIDLWPIVEYCCICGEPSHKSGIPMYEDLVLPNDWQGEWGGKPACDHCRQVQGKLSGPVTEREFRRMKAGVLLLNIPLAEGAAK